MESILNAFLPAAIILVLLFLPLLSVVVVVYVQKQLERRNGRRSPLKEKLLHQAGAQARMKADALGDDVMERIVRLIVIGPLAMLAILLPRVRWWQLKFGWFEWVVGVGAVVVTVLLTRQILRLRKERRKWEEGMLAEIAAAQSLDRLRGQGCEVFHDVPTGKDFNLDHVIVGPSSVLLIETKSRRKPGKGLGSADVQFDGRKLVFPGGKFEQKPLQQAEAEAAWLAKYLQGETGQ